MNHDEIKERTGEGIGGALGALIYFLAGVITLFLREALNDYWAAKGAPAPSGWTG